MASIDVILDIIQKRLVGSFYGPKQLQPGRKLLGADPQIQKLVSEIVNVVVGVLVVAAKSSNARPIFTANVLKDLAEATMLMGAP
jgi:hypothetical protein